VNGPREPDEHGVGPVPRGERPLPPPAPDPEPAPEREAGAMSIIDHLDELRRVLVHSLLAAGVAIILAWFWSAPMLDLLVRPVKEYGVYFTAPNEAFLIRMKLSALAGLFAVLPFILFRIYGFVVPGLYHRERRLVTPLLLVTTLLFYTGVAFSFLVVVPIVVRFMISFGTSIMQPLLTVSPYFDFVAQMCLAFGLIFELPVLVFVLSAIGIVNPRWLLRSWRWALVIIFTVSAILTPPDALSQCAMAIPVSLLYISSVLVAILATRGRERRRRAEATAADAAREESEP
jgi:sec-independent protein translocase protein TatC